MPLMLGRAAKPILVALLNLALQKRLKRGEPRRRLHLRPGGERVELAHHQTWRHLPHKTPEEPWANFQEDSEHHEIRPRFITGEIPANMVLACASVGS